MFAPLIELARSKLRPTQFSRYVSGGQVVAAIETITGNCYVGICVDTVCSLGMCAERNAIGSMLTEGENHIRRLVCLKGEQVILPCGACRELLMQLHPENCDMEVLCDIDGSLLTLKSLLPSWWDQQPVTASSTELS